MCWVTSHRGMMMAHPPSRVAAVRCPASLSLSLSDSLSLSLSLFFYFYFFLLITALACLGIIEKRTILTRETLEERLAKGKAALQGSKSRAGRAVNNARIVSRWASFDRPL